MPSRRRPPAAVGKPSFPRFKVYYLLRRRVRFEPRPLDFRERDLPNATAYGGSEGIYNNLRNPRNDAIRLAPASPAKQHRAEAAPGPDGDDNGPGSEPPPHGRFRYVSTFVTSRRRPPAAVGKPSFAYFPVDYLLHDVWRLTSQRSFDIESPRLDGVRKIRRHGHKPPESGELCPAIRVDEDGFLRYRLAVETILAVKVSYLVSTPLIGRNLNDPAAWHTQNPTRW
ncbi:hypothetical protein THAOC_25195 [Thalassiosira oceanica]|uniref:Uncharacterized protein n=1 Tax=Thalassiosira oceanica TaxID=159749 RepID=K0RRY3_THAOC|nr:hypothetical protein THAOC_25195 [Thalassiosira oceanica]|eukprot:EJK55109.1 hypothetical protein THAOC_25195 [Thalassiosira oceanica]